jgi:hypothetical protein
VLSEHWECLETDFAQTYQIDLSDIFRQQLSLRRAWVLFKGLGLNSRFARAVGISTTWTASDYLLAIIADRVAENTWAYAQSLSKNPIKRPVPLDRPAFREIERDEDKPPVRVLPSSELKSWLANID